MNARDLGGLSLVTGTRTARGAIVRSGAVDGLTGRGWDQLVGFGVRTIVDLRDRTERPVATSRPPLGVEVISIPLEEGLDSDADYDRWRSAGLLATPTYFAEFVRRWPDRCQAVLGAVASAAPGAVLVHCSKGRDRAGLISALILELVGVAESEIADDYALSFDSPEGTDESRAVAELYRTLDCTPRDAAAGAIRDLRALRLGEVLPIDQLVVERLRRRLLEEGSQ